MSKITKKILGCTFALMAAVILIAGLSMYDVSDNGGVVGASAQETVTENVKIVSSGAALTTPIVKATAKPKPTSVVKTTKKPASVTQSIKFTKKITNIKAGKKYTFKVKVVGSDSKVKWSVSNKKYAIISQKGEFRGKRIGKVYVTAKADDKSVKCKVKIKGKKKIAIDAGHQSRGDSSTEPVGPGSSTRKAKVAGGATGVATNIPEYKLTLNVAKKLKSVLISRGYDVYMVRTKNDVNISNKRRAINANKSGSDIYIRIHGDSSGSSSVRGASVLYPSKSNPYVSKLSKASKKLSKALINKYCATTGIKNRGMVVRNDLTGTNWSKIPVSLIEMGFLSNPSEDRKMQDSKFQKKMAKGIANGIDAYFGF